MILKLIFLLVLATGALFVSSILKKASLQGAARFWPLAAAAGITVLMFWRHVASLVLIVIVAVLVLGALMRGARGRLFGNRNVSLLNVTTIVFLAYFVLVIAFKLVLLSQAE